MIRRTLTDGHAQRADDAVRPRQPSPERVRVKAPADLRNCTGKTQGHLFRVGETFLMQLHRSRPEPRLSTFERCWLSGATGLAQRTGDTRDLFALRSPGSVSPLCARLTRPLKRTALLAKPVNGINAPHRPDCVAEVRVLCERVSLSACLSVETGIFLLNWGAEQVIRP